jgi:hypothetical protein
MGEEDVMHAFDWLMLLMERPGAAARSEAGALDLMLPRMSA